MSTLLITVTSGRPKAFEMFAKVIAKQTRKDWDMLIVSDDYEGYKTPKLKTGKVHKVSRDPSNDTRPSICENWLAALDWIDKHSEYTDFIIAEDDDWYHEKYIDETLELLENADLVGWHYDAYYYVLSRKARRTFNEGYASLAATGFKRSVIPWFRQVTEHCGFTGSVFLDGVLWLGIAEMQTIPQAGITQNGVVVAGAPTDVYKTVARFNGSKLLANNFTGQRWGLQEEVYYDDDGVLCVRTNEPVLDGTGNIKDEHPRHVGLKEPYHPGKRGLSPNGHNPRLGGGHDQSGDLLRKWLGTDAEMYLAITRDPRKERAANGGERFKGGVLICMGAAEKVEGKYN